ncbi:hypothetical protein LMH73_013820 [Vibrio splendidus]|nr:hypothetical protein [Vibrio splendidus]MCC4883070.1 hypothetical protein [Vibrio splendidus]
MHVATTDQLAIINNLISSIRESYNTINRLGNCFADHCDAVSEILLESMESHSISGGYLVNGFYTHAYPDSARSVYGHTWIEWGDYIIDATRCQFDSNEFLILDSDPSSILYQSE